MRGKLTDLQAQTRYAAREARRTFPKVHSYGAVGARPWLRRKLAQAMAMFTKIEWEAEYLRRRNLKYKRSRAELENRQRGARLHAEAVARRQQRIAA